MKIKVYLLSLAFILIIAISLTLSYFFDGFSNWSGWNVISSISTVLGSFGLIAIAYQLFLQKKEFDQGQIEFLMGLDSKLQEAKDSYHFAWNVLREYPVIPAKMEVNEWRNVVHALSQCYESARFIYKLARLVENNVISAEGLYTLYYNEVIDAADDRFEFLWEWCGTGLGLAANYNAEEILRMSIQTKKLCAVLFELDKENGGSGYEFMIDNFERIEKNILTGNSTKPSQSDERRVEIIDNE